MRKIPTLYLRDPQNLKRVLDEVVEEAAWVLQGEGRATEKYDGSACLVYLGALYRRHVVKVGKARPPGWVHWSFSEAQHTGHGWAPVTEQTSDQYHREAWKQRNRDRPPGTCELVGPKVQRNPYHLGEHMLWNHGDPLEDFERTFDGIHAFLMGREIEGVVWHHPDGRMAKIKRRDFGLPWPVQR